MNNPIKKVDKCLEDILKSGNLIKKIKLKINTYNDREKIISVLANNGYPVYVEERPISNSSIPEYFVVFELPIKPTKEDNQ